MKTARKMLQDSNVKISFDSRLGVEIIDLMKQYAKQVAKKSLVDAADNLSQAPGTFNSDYSSQKLSILNTEIQTQ